MVFIDKPIRLIEVVPYDANWPKQFEQEAQMIKYALGDNCIDVYYVGSTSVPGLVAKPIIDMLPVVKNLLEVDATNEWMLKIGYQANGEYGIPLRRFFQKGGNKPTHHVHVFEVGNLDIERHIKFRDWLRKHATDRENYAVLKQELAHKYPNNAIAYCLGKSDFIKNIDEKQNKYSSQ